MLITNKTKQAAVNETMKVLYQCASLKTLKDSNVSTSQTTCMAALIQALPHAYAFKLIRLLLRMFFKAW